MEHSPREHGGENVPQISWPGGDRFACFDSMRFHSLSSHHETELSLTNHIFLFVAAHFMVLFSLASCMGKLWSALSSEDVRQKVTMTQWYSMHFVSLQIPADQL